MALAFWNPLAWPRRRRGRAVLAGVLLVLAAGLTYVLLSLQTIDARLGADLMVQGPGLLTAAPTLLVVPAAPSRPVPAATIAALMHLPGVKGTTVFYNLGQLSAQECPA